MKRPERRAGFTLLEVLAAFLVFAVLFTVLAGTASEAFRKEAQHRRVKLSKELRAKLERIEARGALLAAIRGCETRIRKGPQAEGRAALAELAARKDELEAADLRRELSRLRSLLRWAPLQRLVARLNLDDLW